MRVWICSLLGVKGHPCDPNKAAQLVKLSFRITNTVHGSLNSLITLQGYSWPGAFPHNYYIILQRSNGEVIHS